jgi:hypothetical protein
LKNIKRNTRLTLPSFTVYICIAVRHIPQPGFCLGWINNLKVGEVSKKRDKVERKKGILVEVCMEEEFQLIFFDVQGLLGIIEMI